MSELSERLDFAVKAAIEAGGVTMRYFRSPSLAVEAKPDKSPVTRADKEAEELLREHIAREFPNDGIVGEEFGVQDGSSEYTWYLDPIDGTQSFFRGIPLFGTMVGLEAGGEAVAGVIVFPALKEMVFAGKGLGAWWCDDLSPRDRKKASCIESVAALRSVSRRQLGHRVREDWKGSRLSKAGSSSRGQSRLSRLLRPLPGCHRTHRDHDRPRGERLGQRPPSTHHGRSRRPLHRLERERHDSRGQRHIQQRPDA